MIWLFLLVLTTPLEEFQQISGNDPWLEFNKGSCYFNLDDPAWALYHYERAHRMLPRNREILQHRLLAAKTLGAGPAPARWLTLERWLSPSERNLLLFGLGGCATLLGSLAFWRGSRRTARMSLVPLGAALLLSGALIYGEVADPPALLVRSALLRSGAGDQYTPVSVTPLKPGRWVRVRGGEGDWIQIELSDGSMGYVSVDKIVII